MSVDLDKKFWSEFSRKNWEKKPILVKNFKAGVSRINSCEVFNWLVQYSDHCRKIGKATGLKFYIDGESRYESEVLQSLPLKEDKSLIGYHRRMSEIYKDYCLVCDELVQVSSSQQITLRKFTHQIYNQIGMPNRLTEIGLYLGNYKKTPFGVHVDGCGVFSFPVEGTKNFRLWSNAYVKKNPDLEMSFEYKKHLKKSKLISAGAGDMTYWPSKAWHIAESNGEFSATWSLGVWVDQPLVEILGEFVQPLIQKKLKNQAFDKSIRFKKSFDKNGFLSGLPPVLTKSADLISQISKDEMHDLIIKNWLIIHSKNGFRSSLRPDLNLKFKTSDQVQIDPENPVLWTRLNSGQICLAVHGILHLIPNSKSAVHFMNKINSGKTFQISTLLNSSPHRLLFRKVLLSLFQVGQLQLVSMEKN